EIGGRVWTHPGRVASLVKGDGPVAGGTQRRDLLPPRMARLWKAVQQDDQRAGVGAGYLRGEAAGRGGDRARHVSARERPRATSRASCSRSTAAARCGTPRAGRGGRRRA